MLNQCDGYFYIPSSAFINTLADEQFLYHLYYYSLQSEEDDNKLNNRGLVFLVANDLCRPIVDLHV